MSSRDQQRRIPASAEVVPEKRGGFGVQDGDLDLVLKRRGGKPIPEDDIMQMFVQICMGLDHVHSKVLSLLQMGS